MSDAWSQGGTPSDTVGDVVAAKKKKPKPTPAPPPAPTPYTPTPGQFAALRRFLDQYGLGDLYDTAVGWLIDGTADNPDRLEVALRDTPQFRTRFAGIIQREANGLPPISINEYVAYENQAYQLMRSYGYPPGFYDQPDDFAGMIGGNVSLTELEQRLASYADVAAVGRDQVRTELARQFADAGVADAVDEMTTGELAAFFIDPARGLQSIRQRLQAAQVGAAAADSGFGALTYGEASRLTGAGVEEAAARQAFGALAQQGDVTRALAGEQGGMAREDQVGVVAGDGQALTELERRRRARQGGFEGGGGFATTGEGVSGLGRGR